MNIAFLHFYYTFGGGEKVSKDTAKFLSSKGVVSHFFILEYSAKQTELPFDLNLPSYIKIAVLPDKTGRLTKRNIDFIVEYVRDNNIKLLIETQKTQYLPQELLDIQGCKKLFWIHQAPMNEAMEELTSRYLAISKEKGLVKRFKLLKYHFKYKKKYGRDSAFEQRWIEWYNEYLKMYDYIVVLCPQYKELIIRNLSLDKQKSDKIFSLINVLDYISDIGVEEKKKKIVYVGRLSKIQKRVNRIIDIWERVYNKISDEWHLEIYGTGPDEDELKEDVNRLNLPRITFKGYSENQEEMYRDASIVMLASDFEGVPLAFIEGQNYGCIPIAFNSFGALSYIVGDNEEYGLSVSPFDVREYSKKLISLCNDDEQRNILHHNILIKRLEYKSEINEVVWTEILNMI